MFNKSKPRKLQIVFISLLIALVVYMVLLMHNKTYDRYEMKATTTYQLAISALPSQNEASNSLKSKFKDQALVLSGYGHWTHELELYHISDHSSEIIVHFNYGQKLLQIKILPAKDREFHNLLHKKEKLLDLVIVDLDKTEYFDLRETFK